MVWQRIISTLRPGPQASCHPTHPPTAQQRSKQCPQTRAALSSNTQDERTPLTFRLEEVAPLSPIPPPKKVARSLGAVIDASCLGFHIPFYPILCFMWTQRRGQDGLRIHVAHDTRTQPFHHLLVAAGNPPALVEEEEFHVPIAHVVPVLLAHRASRVCHVCMCVVGKCGGRGVGQTSARHAQARAQKSPLHVRTKQRPVEPDKNRDGCFYSQALTNTGTRS